MAAEEIGQTAFMKMGCHPEAIQAVVEPSAAVWLLAAAYANYRRAEDGVLTAGEPYQGWPNVFWHPAHRIKAAPFVSRFWRLHSKEDSAELAELDTITLRQWLGYARRRLDVVERYGLTLWLVGQLTGSHGGVRSLMKVVEARS